MGSSGGIPNIDLSKGFFPTMPQISQGSFQPWDMGQIGMDAGLPPPLPQPAAPAPTNVFDAVARRGTMARPKDPFQGVGARNFGR